MTTQQDLSKYKMLSETEHVLLRPARYVGSINNKKSNEWFIENGQIVYREVEVNPAFLKLFDEIISNSADHAKRPEGAHLNKIDVVVNKILGTIQVRDNGGIPVAEKEAKPGVKLWIPDMIFGHLRSGTNFDNDPDSTTTGQNGEGSSLTNIFSKFFRVRTCDGIQSFSIEYKDNMSSKTEPQVAHIKGVGGIKQYGFTEITYEPEVSRFGMTGITDDMIAMIERRCWEIAATNPFIDVTFNGRPSPVKGFKDLIDMFSKDAVYYGGLKWKFGLTHSEDGFKHISFVNSTLTFEGGTHIEYVMDKVVEAIRDHIEKKTKQKIKPAEIKSQFTLILDCTINNPRYSSQTKENLITAPSDFGSKLEIDEKFIKALIASPIMKKMLEWAERRKVAEEMKEAQKEVDKARRSSLHHIPKYHPATVTDPKKRVLFLAEGDSALKPLKAAKQSIHGLFPLRGKPDNVLDKSIKFLMGQQEFQHILQIMGLDLSGKVDLDKLNYHSLVVATDADLDGIHIRGLLVVAFHRFWPELISKGVLKFMKTPVVVATVGKKHHEFLKQEDFDAWVAANPNVKYTSKYYKGLGSWDTDNMARFMTDPKYMYTVKPLDDDDRESLSLAFDTDRADDRKKWLALHV